MTRIDISIEEYNALKDRITELEKTIARQDQTIENYEIQVDSLMASLDTVLHQTTWLERVFNWKNIVSLIEEDLNE